MNADCVVLSRLQSIPSSTKEAPSFVLGRWLAAFEGCVDNGAVAATIGTCELSTIFTKRCLPHCGGQVARVAGDLQRSYGGRSRQRTRGVGRKDPVDHR
jgi:hypothetical protein